MTLLSFTAPPAKVAFSRRILDLILFMDLDTVTWGLQGWIGRLDGFFLDLWCVSGFLDFGFF